VSEPAVQQATAAAPHRATLRGHLAICRFDHWFKNAFVLPGIVVALAFGERLEPSRLLWRTLIALLAIGLVASSNYVINELRDAPFDRFHPSKRSRPVPAGQVNPTVALAQWLALGALGIALGGALSRPLAGVLALLWLMGCVYNLPPLRSKDLPYLDVLSESVNNPLRMLAGWYLVDPPAFPPASLLLTYWLVGAYFMALKRFAEWREIGDAARAEAYRRSFRHYDGDRLLVSVIFYAAAAMLFFGAFSMRYRLSLLLSFPFVALVMAVYLRLALAPHSPVQTPERLYREPLLLAAVISCAIVMTACLFLDLPWLGELLGPTAPTSAGG
jgi:4-hydroxybenzoate polyprenyltransferase